MIGTLIAPDPFSAAHRAFLWVRYPILMAALAYWILRDGRTQQQAIISLTLATLFLVFDLLLQHYRGTDLFGRPYIDLVDFIRLTGPYASPRIGIMLTWIGFPALYYLWSKTLTVGRYRIACILVMFILNALYIWAIFLSGERMAFLLCLFGLGLSVILLKNARWIFLSLLLVTGATVGYLHYNKPTMVVRQVALSAIDIKGFRESPYGQIMHSAWKMWPDYPLLGAGMKGFRLHCPEARYGETTPTALIWRCGLHPHNPYLELLTDSGLIGLTLYIFAIAAIFMECWHHRRRIGTDLVLAGLFITFMIRIWPLVAVTSQFIPWSAGPFWFLVGFLLARLASAPHAVSEKK